MCAAPVLLTPHHQRNAGDQSSRPFTGVHSTTLKSALEDAQVPMEASSRRTCATATSASYRWHQLARLGRP